MDIDQKPDYAEYLKGRRVVPDVVNILTYDVKRENDINNNDGDSPVTKHGKLLNYIYIVY